MFLLDVNLTVARSISDSCAAKLEQMCLFKIFNPPCMHKKKTEALRFVFWISFRKVGSFFQNASINLFHMR